MHKTLFSLSLSKEQKAVAALFSAFALAFTAHEIYSTFDFYRDIENVDAHILGRVGYEVAGFAHSVLFCLALVTAKGRKSLLLRAVFVAVVPLLFIGAARNFLTDEASYSPPSLLPLVLFSLNFLLAKLIFALARLFVRFRRKQVERPKIRRLARSALRFLLASVGALAAAFALSVPLAALFWKINDYPTLNGLGLGVGFPELCYLTALMVWFPASLLLIFVLPKRIWTDFGTISFAAFFFNFAVLSAFLFEGSIGFEGVCLWNPLEDTRHSPTFNVRAVPLLQTGMTAQEALALVGDPLSARRLDTERTPLDFSDPNAFHGNFTLRFTGDGASSIADFAWYELWLEFEDGRLKEIEGTWQYD